MANDLQNPRIAQALKALFAVAGIFLFFFIFLCFWAFFFMPIANNSPNLFWALYLTGPLCFFVPVWLLLKSCISRPLFIIAIGLITLITLVAVPKFMRPGPAATRIIEDLRVLDGSEELYAVEVEKSARRSIQNNEGGH